MFARRNVIRIVLFGTLAVGIAGYGTVRLFHRGPGWDATTKRFTLPNGWRLTPAGKSIPLPGDMPGNIIFVNGGKNAIVNTCGFHNHSVSLIDLANEKVEKSVSLDRSWIGLCEVTPGELWVSAGGSSSRQGQQTAAGTGVHRLKFSASDLQAPEGFPIAGIDQKAQFVSNMVAGEKGIYALNVQTNEVFRLGKDATVLASAKVGYRPYAAALSPDGSRLAVTNWGDKSVTILNSTTLAIDAKVSVQAHPTAIIWARDGRMFVSNAGSNTVSVIQNGKTTETIRTNFERTDRIGSTPVALAMSPDQTKLFVANAGSNCIAMLNIADKSRSQVSGYIPTGRYPSAVAVTPDGKRLLVATAKGFYGPNAISLPGAKKPAPGSNPRGNDPKSQFTYIGDQLAGSLSFVDVPNAIELAKYTKLVVENLPRGLDNAPSATERRDIERNAFAKIKHVIYVIRENRTYDQVLGDIAKGNGEPSLTLFGREITPNSHKIVNDFVLLDNLYTDGETSQAGHQWTDAAYANDYTEKQWILSYSGRQEVSSDTRLTSSPGEYIWTQARKHGLKARVYGEYVSMQEDHGSADSEELKRDPEKFGFSATFEKIFARGGRDTEKVSDFLREMHQAETAGNWLSLMVMALPEDHTNGFSAGRNSPRAMVGNNDLAIGQLVDAVSHSKFWKDTAIFVIQDDAQDGPDHVDSHRTVGIVVSPFVRRGVIDSTMYSTSSMLRTMELILGLPPMSDFDAHATPMYASFTSIPDLSPFSLVKPTIDLNERNPGGTELARRSSKLDFSDVDRADFNELNRILWSGYRPGVPYPAPVRSR